MSNKSQAAHQKAFQRGQDDWRNSKPGEGGNPYPPQSPDHGFWQQGWEAERDVHHK
jgi:hypothetical protein